MATRTVPEPTSTFAAIPAGVYPATIREITSVWKEPDIYHKDKYEQLEVTWGIDADEIDDEEERPEIFTIRSWFSPSMNDKANLVLKLLPAIGVEQAAPGEDWDEQDWLGMTCQVQIDKYVNDAGYERNKIVAYMALPRKKNRANKDLF